MHNCKIPLTIQHFTYSTSSFETSSVCNTPTWVQRIFMKPKYSTNSPRYLVNRPSTYRLHWSDHTRYTNTHEYLPDFIPFSLQSYLDNKEPHTKMPLLEFRTLLFCLYKFNNPLSLLLRKSDDDQHYNTAIHQHTSAIHLKNLFVTDWLVIDN